MERGQSMAFRVYTDSEREQFARTAHTQLANSVTAADVANVWREHYGKLGHRVMGRLLLGGGVEDALRKGTGRRQPLEAAAG